VCRTFADKCITGIEPNLERIEQNLNSSLMLVTPLSLHIGYDKAARIASKALAENISIKKAALGLGFVTEEEFNKWVDPRRMIYPDRHKPD
jgi:fumarate hydratase class II